MHKLGRDGLTEKAGDLIKDNTLSRDQLGSGLGCLGLRFQNAFDSVVKGGSDKFIWNPKDKGSAREHLYELIVLG